MTEAAARLAEIEASRDEALAAADRLDDATARFHEAATRMAGDWSRALDGVQDTLIDLDCVVLDLEAKNRERGGSR